MGHRIKEEEWGKGRGGSGLVSCLKLENLMIIQLVVSHPSLQLVVSHIRGTVLQFACGLAMAMKEAQYKKVRMGKGVKMFSSRAIQQDLED